MTGPDKPAESAAPRKAAKCPVCGKPPVERYRPFCSKRCAQIDLHRWLTGAYAIPAVEDDAMSAGGDADGESRDG